MTTLDLQKRIKNIQGQLDGITKMLESDKACLDVLTQFKAAKAGLEKATALFVQEHLTKCMTEQKVSPAKKAEVEKIILELAKS